MDNNQPTTISERIIDENRWYGMLTIDNIKQVTDAIRRKLTGKKFVFVAVNEWRGFIPEVRTDQELQPSKSGDPINTYFGDKREFAGFNVCDSYGVWGCSTNTNDPKKYDHEYHNPHFSFDWNSITINQRAPAGQLLHWVIAIQDK